MSNPVTTPLTLRSALAYIAAHPQSQLEIILVRQDLLE